MRLPIDGTDGSEPVLGTCGNVVIGTGLGVGIGVFGGVGVVTGLGAGNEGLQHNCPACTEKAAILITAVVMNLIGVRYVI